MSIFANIRPVDFAALAGPMIGPAQGAATSAPADEARPAATRAGKAIVTHTGKRRTAGLRKAAGILDHLPQVGETLWGVLYGYFDLCHLLLALLQKIPGTCDRLRVATLSASRRNAVELGALYDIQAVRRIDTLVSDFMRKSDRENFAILLETMAERGQRVAAARSHCKLLLLEMDTGDRYTLSGSGNLRTSRNAEALTLCREDAAAAPVHGFYDAWHEEAMVGHEVHANDRQTAG